MRIYLEHLRFVLTLALTLGLTSCTALVPGWFDECSADDPSCSNKTAFTGTGYGACNVKDFGAKGDGATDDTAAIQAAVNSCGLIYLPPTTGGTCYVVSATITFVGHGNGAVGDDAQPACVLNISATASTFVSQGGVLGSGTTIMGARFANLLLTRKTAPAPGADGLDLLGVTDDIHVLNVISEKNYDGIALGVTGWSVLRNVVSRSNARHGINMGLGGNPQWHWNNVSSTTNGGDGFHVECIGSLQATLGEYIHIEASGNGGNGFTAIGAPACPIHGLRVIDASFHDDAGWEMYLDTFGNMHSFTNLRTSGGAGIYVSGNDNPGLDGVELINPTISGSRAHGLTIYASNWAVIGGSISNNAGSGIAAEAGQARIVGVTTNANGGHGTFADPSSTTFVRIVGGVSAGNGAGADYCAGNCGRVTYSPSLTSPVTPPAGPSLAGVARTIGAGICNVRDYGAKGDGTTDDTAAIQIAATTCPVIYLPETPQGTCYVVSSEIHLAGNGQGAVGDNQWRSCIASTKPSARVLVAGPGQGARFANLRITHTTAPAAGGTGLDITQGTTSVIGINLRLESNYDAIVLGPSANSALIDLYVLHNAGHGIKLGVQGQQQWGLYNIASGFNGGDEFHLECTGTGVAVPGPFVSLETFAGGGSGFRAVGSQPCSLTGVQILGGFFGGDRSNELFFDTYSVGAGHLIEGVELDTDSPGAYFSPNNVAVTLLAPLYNGATTSHGILMQAQNWSIEGGFLGYFTGGSGLAAPGGAGKVTGLMSLSNANYGLFVDASAVLSGIDARANGLAQIQCGSDCVNLGP